MVQNRNKERHKAADDLPKQIHEVQRDVAESMKQQLQAIDLRSGEESDMGPISHRSVQTCGWVGVGGVT